MWWWAVGLGRHRLSKIAFSIPSPSWYWQRCQWLLRFLHVAEDSQQPDTAGIAPCTLKLGDITYAPSTALGTEQALDDTQCRQAMVSGWSLAAQRTAQGDFSVHDDLTTDIIKQLNIPGRVLRQIDGIRLIRGSDHLLKTWSPRLAFRCLSGRAPWSLRRSELIGCGFVPGDSCLQPIRSSKHRVLALRALSKSSSALIRRASASLHFWFESGESTPQQSLSRQSFPGLADRMPATLNVFSQGGANAGFAQQYFQWLSHVSGSWW